LQAGMVGKYVGLMCLHVFLVRMLTLCSESIGGAGVIERREDHQR